MVRKAIIPAAGFGTRFLPAAKSQPKEMLPIVDTPTIQYVVEEAAASGITDILMIIGKGKRSIEEHFDRNFDLERKILPVAGYFLSEFQLGYQQHFSAEHEFWKVFRRLWTASAASSAASRMPKASSASPTTASTESRSASPLSAPSAAPVNC